MNERPAKLLRICLGLAATLVVLGLGFLITNLILHATSQSSTTPVSTQVLAVRTLSPSQVEVTVTVRSHATTTSHVNCLLGIELPSIPLAYPNRVTLDLAPGQLQQITEIRSLLKPDAAQVTTTDVAFACT